MPFSFIQIKELSSLEWLPFEVLEAVVEGGVHFVGVLGEEGEDGGAVFDFEGVDFLFDFDAAGDFVVEAFPDEGCGDLGLESIFLGVGVVKYFFVEFFVAGVDVDFVPDEVVTDYGIDTDAVGDPEGFTDPVVAYRGVAGVEAVVVFAVLDELLPKLFTELMTGLFILGTGFWHRCSSGVYGNLSIVKGF